MGRGRVSRQNTSDKILHKKEGYERMIASECLGLLGVSIFIKFRTCLHCAN